MPGSMVAPGDMRRELFCLRQPELAVRWPQALREMIYENVRQTFSFSRTALRACPRTAFWKNWTTRRIIFAALNPTR